MESMAEGWAVRTRNGFVHVTNGPTFSVMLGEFGMDGFIPWEELVLFGLHVLWRSLYPRVATAACFVQSKTLVSPHKPYWTALFAQVAWLILPPEPIRDAMDIGRPDLAHIVQKAYLEWIARVRDPTLVEDALRGSSTYISNGRHRVGSVRQKRIARQKIQKFAGTRW